MNNMQAITTLEHAGKYLVATRGLHSEILRLHATDAARSSNPDIQSIALLSVLLARVLRRDDCEWVSDICSALDLPYGAAA